MQLAAGPGPAWSANGGPISCKSQQKNGQHMMRPMWQQEYCYYNWVTTQEDQRSLPHQPSCRKSESNKRGQPQCRLVKYYCQRHSGRDLEINLCTGVAIKPCYNWLYVYMLPCYPLPHQSPLAHLLNFYKIVIIEINRQFFSQNFGGVFFFFSVALFSRREGEYS